MKQKHYNRTWERIKWWLYHPRFELIYLLGGVPHEHMVGPNGAMALHYRNIESVMSRLVDSTMQKGKEMVD